MKIKNKILVILGMVLGLFVFAPSVNAKTATAQQLVDAINNSGVKVHDIKNTTEFKAGANIANNEISVIFSAVDPGSINIKTYNMKYDSSSNVLSYEKTLEENDLLDGNEIFDLLLDSLMNSMGYSDYKEVYVQYMSNLTSMNQTDYKPSFSEIGYETEFTQNGDASGSIKIKMELSDKAYLFMKNYSDTMGTGTGNLEPDSTSDGKVPAQPNTGVFDENAWIVILGLSVALIAVVLGNRKKIYKI